jgi:hypothetical protein
VNDTCATCRGLTQCAIFTFGASFTSGLGTSSFASSSRSQTRSFDEKPVPTFPA